MADPAIVPPTWTIYQPLLVGLGAVVLATLGNSLLEMLKVALSDRRLKTIMVIAIREELRVRVAALEGAIKTLSEPTKDMIQIPITESFPAYNHYMPYLGLLGDKRSSAISRAYSYLHSMPDFLVNIGKFTRVEGRLYVHTSSQMREHLQGISRKMLLEVKHGFDALA